MNRRRFVQLSLLLSLPSLAALPSLSPAATTTAATRSVYRLSVRGRRGSRAAKSHCNNKLFASAEAADRNRAHRGDHARIVSFQMSEEDFSTLFSHSEVADLRRLKRSSAGLWRDYR
ncbi:MAG TPA: hypothetical protein PLS90_15260 [Candidatus Sumerlaeota bacterium]|nr:MAG: hypothetical protein BWZ08_01786 [candidate division BRC1 bacterium ADurb.BinA292]HPK03805.1 hypothetical protein [Candidatus Sumerlaeota bacterium]